MFDYEKFMLELNDSDLLGLEYMEKTLIENMKEIIKKNDIETGNYIKEDYIVSLFYAVKELNNCNFIYEMTNVKNNFEQDLYFNVKGKLIEEVRNYLEMDV